MTVEERRVSVNEKINARAERRAYYESLPGFQLLTKRQQGIILASEYIQDFARANISEKAKEFQEKRWCHPLIQHLESEAPLTAKEINERDRPSDFFDAHYESNDEDECVRRVKSFGYPCIVLFRQDIGPDFHAPIHTFLVTGELANGEVQVWHTDGSSGPIEKGELRKTFKECEEYCAVLGHGLGVGIRKVRCLPSPEHPSGEIEPQCQV